MTFVDAIERRLREIQRERKEGGEAVSRHEPPPPPERWSWEHIDVSAVNGVIEAKVGSVYSSGCFNCHRYWERDRGYVEVFVDGPYGPSKAMTECPQCRTLRKRVKSITDARLPSKFDGRDFEWSAVSVPGSSGDELHRALMQWLADEVVRWVGGNHVDEPPSIALLGPTGRGKSHAAFMVAKYAIHEGIPVRWVEWSKLLGEVMSKSKSQREAFEDAFVDPGLVVVDDLGVGSHSGWARDIACAFLEQIPKRVVCVFTSNGIPGDDGPNGLDSMIGDRASSRLSGVCGRGEAFFTFTGGDWRKGSR